MFNRYRTVVSIFCGTALSLLLADGRAQFTFASDNADNYGGAGELGWTNNANGGVVGTLGPFRRKRAQPMLSVIPPSPVFQQRT